jgi:hypothetical protein
VPVCGPDTLYAVPHRWVDFLTCEPKRMRPRLAIEQEIEAVVKSLQEAGHGIGVEFDLEPVEESE